LDFTFLLLFIYGASEKRSRHAASMISIKPVNIGLERKQGPKPLTNMCPIFKKNNKKTIAYLYTDFTQQSIALLAAFNAIHLIFFSI